LSGVEAARSGSLAALGQRPPRLVLRVVIYSALTLGIGAATLLVFIRHFEQRRAEQTARLQASVVTQAVVDKLRPSDLRVPLPNARRLELGRVFRARVLDPATPAAAILTPNRRFVYATDPRLYGARLEASDLFARALAGYVASDRASIQVEGATRRVLRVLSPFRLADGSTGILLVEKDYAPIASNAREAAIAVAAVLELVLLSLWLCLIPIMRAVTRRIHRQLDTIAHLALHDDLTGLPNRTQLAARLDEVLKRGDDGRVGILFIDLDRFKEVNDTLGHDRGNELLIEIAGRIGPMLGPRELVARLGGDEFAVLSEYAVDERSALALASRLQDVIAEPCLLAGVSVELRASVGIALAPAHGASRDELLRCADIAMYAAKRAGAPQVFVPELDDHSPVRLAMTGELRNALERRELLVYYQPQVDMRTGTLRGVEALVRWRHPTRGLLQPHAFLTAVEHGGLMRRLTSFVLEEALRQLRAWRDAGLELDLAVNVSFWDLADPEFPDQVGALLAELGIEPSSLELEVTESVLLSESVRSGGRLERLAGEGIRVAIDDFGVGYSSLGQLKNLPAQVLKIDRSFIAGMVSDPSDAAIVRSTIELAHNLGLEVVAEGVETELHLARLQEARCDIGQGFFLGRPLPPGANPAAVHLAGSSLVPQPDGANVVPLRAASA
jgi:diguanylate cyclase (GGDEF)-like protein